MQDTQSTPYIHTEICLWLDFYGLLLTDRSREVLELYFSEDMSLSEIAEYLEISRQAVHDKIRQGCQQLKGYEDKLGLCARYLEQKSCLTQAMTDLDQGNLNEAWNKLRQLRDLLA